VPAALHGAVVGLVALSAEHAGEVRRILATPEVRRWWGDEARPGWSLEEPASSTRFAVRVDGEVRGMIQYSEEEAPRYRHAGIDIILDPAVHGRGLGRDAVATLAHHLIRNR
jgi:RimJ/RimL family protein N-acetyltransferase